MTEVQTWQSMTDKERGAAMEAMVRSIYPELPEGEAAYDRISYLLWNYTGFPYFYIPDEQGGPITHFRRQLQDWHDGKVDYEGWPIG